MLEKRYVIVCALQDIATFCTDIVLRHYSYECRASTQERPYVSRPSRTKQLANPKLRPELTKDIPKDFTASKTPTTAGTAKYERGRKLNREGHNPSRPPSPTSSISSISTISTTRSRSVSSDLERRERSAERRRSTESHDDFFKSENASEAKMSSRYRRRPSPEDFNISRARSTSRQDSHKYRQRSRDSLREEPGKGRGRSPVQSPKAADTRTKPSERDRSLSPYSKRLALTQAMSTGGRI
ncbi:hypothetical protein KEM54_003795 [Ascosphaera aggregata]|nr:hypothetical protein KEM54_003795 [Ascosphaera aggregata]